MTMAIGISRNQREFSTDGVSSGAYEPSMPSPPAAEVEIARSGAT